MMNNDNVNHPKHYANSCSLECIDAMLIAYGEPVVYDFCICNAFKYLWRHKNKNGLEDLYKANWYRKKAEEIREEYNNNIENKLHIINLNEHILSIMLAKAIKETNDSDKTK